MTVAETLLDLGEQLWRANREGDGANNALVTYRLDVTAVVEGNEVELPSYATSVYNRAGDQWLCVFHQQTAL
ncbi:MAG TPA: hypothetical protein VFT31_17725 [Kribbella sp.]|nr:hypothetical protein [Kribbella sp.]